jgi:uncharacterized membrane protein YhhN
MAPVPLALGALAAAAAGVDWVAVSSDRPGLRRLEYGAKPAVPLLLLGAALVVARPPAGVVGWLAGALAFYLAGDVFLMLPGDRLAAFGAGLGSFLVGQVLMTVALFARGATAGPAAGALILLLVALVLPARRLATALRRPGRGPLVPPVLLYAAALLVMAAAACAVGVAPAPGSGAAPAALVGGLLFVASDTLLALDRFDRPLPRARLLVHSTYHLALFGLVAGLLIR